MNNKYYLLNTVLNMWFSKDGGLTNDFSNAKVYDSPNIQKPDYSLNNEDWKVVASKDIVKGMGEGHTYRLKNDSKPCGSFDKPSFEDVIKDIADTYVGYTNRQTFVDEVMSYYRKYQPEEDVNDLITNMRQEIDSLKFRLQQSDIAFKYLTEHCAKTSSDSNTILKARNNYFDSWQESERKYFQLVESIKKLLK